MKTASVWLSGFLLGISVIMLVVDMDDGVGLSFEALSILGMSVVTGFFAFVFHRLEKV